VGRVPAQGRHCPSSHVLLHPPTAQTAPPLQGVRHGQDQRLSESQAARGLPLPGRSGHGEAGDVH